MRSLKSFAGLINRAAYAAAPRTAPTVQGFAVRNAANATRGYAILSATAGAAALGSTMTLRVMGYDVPYPYILGSALAIAGGVYWYELVATKHEKEAPLKAYVEASPHMRSLSMADQDGKPFTAKDLTGKFAVITFGTTDTTDTEAVANIAKACEAVTQRSSAVVTPVFISLDASRDKPADLRRLVTASPGMVALTGDADGLLACANKFKKQELSVRQTATKDQESIKHGNVVDETYVSSYIYVVNPQGDFVSMMARNLPPEKLSNQICLSI